MKNLTISLELLKEQKEILINMIQDWGEACDKNQRKQAHLIEGLLWLIDAIQNRIEVDGEASITLYDK